MKLSRPLVFFDLETTGPVVSDARIVQIGVTKCMPDRSIRLYEEIFNPGVPIPAEATAIHGITDALVANAPTFAARAHLLWRAFKDSDLAGYNLLSYDVPVLWEEFHRAGIDWDLSGVRIIDAEKIFKKKEPRTLQAAVKFYLDRELEDGHDAAVDAQATYEVFFAQLQRYPDLGQMSLDELAQYSTFDERPRIDLAGRLVRDEDGDAVFAFGKHRGKKVKDEIGYAKWMLGAEFSANTKLHVQRELERIENTRSV